MSCSSRSLLAMSDCSRLEVAAKAASAAFPSSSFSSSSLLRWKMDDDDARAAPAPAVAPPLRPSPSPSPSPRGWLLRAVGWSWSAAPLVVVMPASRAWCVMVASCC